MNLDKVKKIDQNKQQLQQQRLKIYKKQWYQEHKEEQLDRVARNVQKLKDLAREAKSVPCLDCGVSYPYYVMDFDHRDPQTKVANVSTLVIKGNRQMLLEEIAKCDVVCANCHRVRTHGVSGVD